MSLSQSLLDRLRKDDQEADKYLSTATVEDATAVVKETSDRHLLSLTGKAVNTLEEVMDYGKPNERLSAATAVLDRSPATKPKSIDLSQTQMIPAEALAILLNGLSKMFSITSDINQIKKAEVETTKPKLIAPKRKKNGK